MARKRIVIWTGIVLVLCFGIGWSGVVHAQTANEPGIYVDADPNFQAAMAAAMMKKHVPAHVVTEREKASYILKASAVDRHQESSGSKFARCMFAYCAGIEGTSAVSAELIQNDAVVWAYQVRKGSGGPRAAQSLSEAIAKHLRNDFFDKQKN